MANPSSDFPTAIHTSTDVSGFGSNKLGSTTPKHTEVEGKQEQEIVAIQTKIGSGSSTPTNGKVLMGNGDGTSAWSDLPAGSGDVTGPASSTTNHIPQFSDTTGKVLKDGLAVVTTLGSPGTDTNIPTEAAVRASIAAAGGGDVSGPASSTNLNIAVFSGTSGKLLADGGATVASLVPSTRTVNAKALSSNVTLTTADIADSTDKRYVTDAQRTVLTNTSGNNTGDQTSVSGNAGTVTGLSVTAGKTLTVSKTITLTSAGDSAVITLPNSTSTLLAVDGSAASLTSFPTLNQNTTGSAAKLTTARAINGVNFDGSADITINDLFYASPGSDHLGTGIKTTLTAGETTTIWQVGYVKSDGKIWLAKADAASTMPGCVLATGSISANASGTYLVRGIARDDSWAWTVGGLLYVSSATGGALTQTAPTGTGKQVQVVGVALSATTIMFMPNMMLLELA